MVGPLYIITVFDRYALTTSILRRGLRVLDAPSPIPPVCENLAYKRTDGAIVSETLPRYSNTIGYRFGRAGISRLTRIFDTIPDI